MSRDRVPNLQLGGLAVDVDDTRATTATEGGIELRSEPLLCELQKQARLPHSCTQQSINNREIYFPWSHGRNKSDLTDLLDRERPGCKSERPASPMAMHLKTCTHDTSRPGVSISGSDFTQRGCKFGALSWRLYYPSRLARKNSGDGVKSLVTNRQQRRAPTHWIRRRAVPLAPNGESRSKRRRPGKYNPYFFIRKNSTYSPRL